MNRAKSAYVYLAIGTAFAVAVYLGEVLTHHNSEYKTKASILYRWFFNKK